MKEKKLVNLLRLRYFHYAKGTFKRMCIFKRIKIDTDSAKHLSETVHSEDSSAVQMRHLE